LPAEEKQHRKKERTSELGAEQAAANEEYEELQAENRFLCKRLKDLTVALRKRHREDDDDDDDTT
jgi:hypothetical protein